MGDILERIGTENNRSAEQTIASLSKRRSSLLKAWKPTNAEKVKKFLRLDVYV